MTILIAPTKFLLSEIACTPTLEGGIGSVMLGEPLELADGRFACCHPWNEVDTAWLGDYVQNIEGAEVLKSDIIPYPVKKSMLD